MCGCFTGVLILTNAQDEESIDIEQQKTQANSKQNLFLGIIFALVCSWCFSFVIVATRYLREIHYSLMITYYSGFATLTYLVYLTVEFL